MLSFSDNAPSWQQLEEMVKWVGGRWLWLVLGLADGGGAAAAGVGAMPASLPVGKGI